VQLDSTAGPYNTVLLLLYTYSLGGARKFTTGKWVTNKKNFEVNLSSFLIDHGTYSHTMITRRGRAQVVPSNQLDSPGTRSSPRVTAAGGSFSSTPGRPPRTPVQDGSPGSVGFKYVLLCAFVLWVSRRARAGGFKIEKEIGGFVLLCARRFGFSWRSPGCKCAPSARTNPPF
jgi:hypothetical protein